VGTKGYIESLHGEVFLMTEGMAQPQKLALLTPPAIFEDFLRGLAGEATLLSPRRQSTPAGWPATSRGARRCGSVIK
jgi:hypothetical protein